MFDFYSQFVICVFVWVAADNEDTRKFIYRKVFIRIELVALHLISTHLVRIVLFLLLQNLFLLQLCVSVSKAETNKEWKKTAHTNRTQVAPFASHFAMCDKGTNWEKIWIWKFTTWSYFKCYRVLVESEMVSYRCNARLHSLSEILENISFEWWTDQRMMFCTCSVTKGIVIVTWDDIVCAPERYVVVCLWARQITVAKQWNG